MNTKQISILGCGWLGLPLAEHFIAKGYKVKGSTTTPSKIPLLASRQIEPFLFTLNTAVKDEELQAVLEGSEVIVLNFPPKRIADVVTIYQEQILRVLSYITSNQKVIFTSSTSVYQNTNDWVTEDLECKPEKESGKAVFAVEQLLQDQLKDRLTILRLSGLIGYDRLPGRFLYNKKEVANAHAPINVIHQDDCIGLIDAIVTKATWGEIINGCTDEHPYRSTFYTRAAQNIGLTPPEFKEGAAVQYKLISNSKSKVLLEYTYTYPDPLELI